ncbi:hypothetical protein BN7_6725 [Wickerhamomyces ciferrii]|uniref:Uncharacterized protein n=1 Tax=Wickerhamomyces ciferrii (strain ATCC 14091 / BCRC 22168 / CBS 111 / JCM 3599 / NBRC 0793 / NRRL Y-1031 F-60-10) TaxID=1206466 RepID=K0L0M1_WICCF|nr:uncharacterized protein BN7_6725 [Wickerhamomyces ciferrii]CCH47114.1 hypothetical protein BN7_6725 [Wickerhamomyces ciferrii]
MSINMRSNALFDRILGYNRINPGSALVQNIGSLIKDRCQVTLNHPVSTILNLNSPKQTQLLPLLNLPSSISGIQEIIGHDCITDLQYENNFTILKKYTYFTAMAIICEKGIKLSTKFIGGTVSSSELTEICDHVIELFPQFFELEGYNLINARSVVFLLLQESFFQIQTRACRLLKGQSNFCSEKTQINLNYEKGIFESFNNCLESMRTPFCLPDDGDQSAKLYLNTSDLSYVSTEPGKKNKKFLKLFGSDYEVSPYLGIIGNVQSKRIDLFTADIDQKLEHDSRFMVVNVFKKVLKILKVGENVDERLFELIRIGGADFFGQRVSTNGIYHSSTENCSKIRTEQQSHRIPNILMDFIIVQTYRKNPSIFNKGCTADQMLPRELWSSTDEDVNQLLEKNQKNYSFNADDSGSPGSIESWENLPSPVPIEDPIDDPPEHDESMNDTTSNPHLEINTYQEAYEFSTDGRNSASLCLKFLQLLIPQDELKKGELLNFILEAIGWSESKTSNTESADLKMNELSLRMLQSGNMHRLIATDSPLDILYAYYKVMFGLNIKNNSKFTDDEVEEFRKSLVYGEKIKDGQSCSKINTESQFVKQYARIRRAEVKFKNSDHRPIKRLLHIIKKLLLHLKLYNEIIICTSCYKGYIISSDNTSHTGNNNEDMTKNPINIDEEYSNASVQANVLNQCTYCGKRPTCYSLSHSSNRYGILNPKFVLVLLYESTWYDTTLKESESYFKILHENDILSVKNNSLIDKLKDTPVDLNDESFKYFDEERERDGFKHIWCHTSLSSDGISMNKKNLSIWNLDLKLLDIVTHPTFTLGIMPQFKKSTTSTGSYELVSNEGQKINYNFTYSEAESLMVSSREIALRYIRDELKQSEIEGIFFDKCHTYSLSSPNVELSNDKMKVIRARDEFYENKMILQVFNHGLGADLQGIHHFTSSTTLSANQPCSHCPINKVDSVNNLLLEVMDNDPHVELEESHSYIKSRMKVLNTKKEKNYIYNQEELKRLPRKNQKLKSNLQHDAGLLKLFGYDLAGEPLDYRNNGVDNILILDTFHLFNENLSRKFTNLVFWPSKKSTVNDNSSFLRSSRKSNLEKFKLNPFVLGSRYNFGKWSARSSSCGSHAAPNLLDFCNAASSNNGSIPYVTGDQQNSLIFLLLVVLHDEKCPLKDQLSESELSQFTEIVSRYIEIGQIINSHQLLTESILGDLEKSVSSFVECYQITFGIDGSTVNSYTNQMSSLYLHYLYNHIIDQIRDLGNMSVFSGFATERSVGSLKRNNHSHQYTAEHVSNKLVLKTVLTGLVHNQLNLFSDENPAAPSTNDNGFYGSKDLLRIKNVILGDNNSYMKPCNLINSGYDMNAAGAEAGIVNGDADAFNTDQSSQFNSCKRRKMEFIDYKFENFWSNTIFLNKPLKEFFLNQLNIEDQKHLMSKLKDIEMVNADNLISNRRLDLDETIGNHAALKIRSLQKVVAIILSKIVKSFEKFCATRTITKFEINSAPIYPQPNTAEIFPSFKHIRTKEKSIIIDNDLNFYQISQIFRISGKIKNKNITITKDYIIGYQLDIDVIRGKGMNFPILFKLSKPLESFHKKENLKAIDVNKIICNEPAEITISSDNLLNTKFYFTHQSILDLSKSKKLLLEYYKLNVSDKTIVEVDGLITYEFETRVEEENINGLEDRLDKETESYDDQQVCYLDYDENTDNNILSDSYSSSNKSDDDNDD